MCLKIQLIYHHWNKWFYVCTPAVARAGNSNDDYGDDDVDDVDEGDDDDDDGDWMGIVYDIFV
jgi:hypothetical protein